MAFLRLGVTAFGGPAAHIAMMEDEFVRRREWLTREDFLDLVGAAGLLPGPSSTEVAIYIGYRRAGWRGLVVAGTCFILPAALIVTALAMAYVRYGRFPVTGSILYGIKPVVIAVVAQALFTFGRTAIKTRWLALLGLLACLASFSGVPAHLILVIAGIVRALGSVARAPKAPPLMLLASPAAAAAALSSSSSNAVVAATSPTLVKLLLVFVKTGAVVFGSGYVLLAFLQADLVTRTGWLTDAQLLDAVAIGQFTPGPVFTTATFIGYLLGSFPGAAVATLGIFLPSFLFVAVSGPLLAKVRKSKTASAFLDGVNVGSVALMAVVAVELGRAAVLDVPTALLGAASAVLLFRWRVNSAWLVLGGGALGVLVNALR